VLKFQFPMQRVGDFMGKAIRRLGGRNAPLAWLRGAWGEVVGEGLARHTRPETIEGGVLSLVVRAGARTADLTPLGELLRERINAAWGRELVTEIRFAVEKIVAPSHAADPDYLPWIRKPRRESTK
jgi:predicted nucleic acid-binding Zn ribbon protein